MKIFLSAPYTFQLEPVSGLINEGYRQWLSSIISVLREDEFEVACCHEREDWGAAIQAPEVAIQHDMASIKEADLLIAYPGHPLSVGVILELGYAMALKKKMIILSEADYEVPYLLNGIPSCTDCTFLTFSSTVQLHELLRQKLYHLQCAKVNK